MTISTVRGPYFVVERPSLPILVLVLTKSVGAGIEFAHGLQMCKLATFDRAIATVPTDGHLCLGMLERAFGVGAMREELAFLLYLMSPFGGGRRMPTDTLEVLASGAIGTVVVDIDRDTRRGCRRLVSKLAVPVGAGEVEFADGGLWIGCLFRLCHVNVFPLGISTIRVGNILLSQAGTIPQVTASSKPTASASVGAFEQRLPSPTAIILALFL